jgi:hypothetical protein
MPAGNHERAQPPVMCGRSPGIDLALAVLAPALALAIGSMLWTASGPLILVWSICWAIGAGVIGWQRRSWWWPHLCPLTMLALVMAWEVVYGRESWASTYIFWMGAAFTVAAAAGAVVGTLLAKWRGRAARVPPERKTQQPVSAGGDDG